MGVREFLALLGDGVEDPDEETFLLFSQDIPSQDLGFVDPKATSLSLSVGGREFAIEQSPGVLSSSRAGGTTGAVLWRITPLLAEWLSSPDSPLFATSVLGGDSHVLELGCGTSGLLALVAAPRVAGYVLTDQPYVSRTLLSNLSSNLPSQGAPPPSSLKNKSDGKGKGKRDRRRKQSFTEQGQQQQPAQSGDTFRTSGGGITFTPLDWESDLPGPSLTNAPSARSFDAVFACDSIYNTALTAPLVQTCVEACRLRSRDPAHPQYHSRSRSPAPARDGDRVSGGDGGEAREGEEDGSPTLCVVAQQLRDPDVFSSWAAAFHESFRMWRLPPEVIGDELGPGSGFVVHVGILRDRDW